MAKDELTPAQRRNEEHLERCYAVQRRGMLERVIAKVAAYDRYIYGNEVAKLTDKEMAPLRDFEQREYDVLLKMRDEILAEMEAVGQT